MKLQSIAVSALAFLSLSLPAAAQDYKVTGLFGAFGVGKATELEKDHVFWVGEFGGTFFNDKGANVIAQASDMACAAN